MMRRISSGTIRGELHVCDVSRARIELTMIGGCFERLVIAGVRN